MESIDEQILGLLSRDGRMSYTDIGKATGLSTSAAQQRVRKLEQRGVITSYRAVLDAEQLGKLLTAFISVRTINPDDDDVLPERLSALPEIISCYSVAGDASFLLMVQVASPLDLERLIKEIRHHANVMTETQLVLSIPFADRPLV